MIRFDIPGLPPSANNAYANMRGGGRILTPEGRAYKTETRSFITRTYPFQVAQVRQNEPYVLYVRLHFDNIENDGWPKKAKSRYKTIDASNRVKLLEDCVKDACGVDDAQHMIVIVEKRLGAPFTNVFLWNMQEEVPPIGDLLAL